MALKITSQISIQNFEAIRDQIAAILTIELPGQTPTANVGVWSERFIPFDKAELPAVNISYDSTPYSEENRNPKTRTGNNTYFIDVHVFSDHTGNTKAKKGDTIASKLAQRISGIVAYILSSAEYYLLDFEPGIVQSKWISEIRTGRFQQAGDTQHNTVVRITFIVKANENVGDLTGVTSELISSKVNINETDEGHKFELILE